MPVSHVRVKIKAGRYNYRGYKFVKQVDRQWAIWNYLGVRVRGDVKSLKKCEELVDAWTRYDYGVA